MTTLIENPQISPSRRIPGNNQKALTIADSIKLYEYLLLLSPHGFVRERIITEKDYITAFYGNPDAAQSLPHLTLANFISSQYTEDEIIRMLAIIARNSNRIKVVLENYKWFPHHTIFIDVKYKVDIKQLVRKISKATRNHIKADNKFPPHFILNPHLTLCKRLSRKQFEKTVVDYAEQVFSDEFTANEMILLRRPVAEPGNYMQVGRFKFGGPETCDTTTQLYLF